MAAVGLVKWWRTLDTRHRRWLIVNAIIATAVVNFVVNAAIGWFNTLGVRHVAVWSIPLAQRTSVFTDAAGTFFFLPLTTNLLCTMAVRVEQRRRALPMIALPYPRTMARIPRQPLRRGVALGAITVIGLTPVTALVIAGIGVGDLNPLSFVLYAALLGVGLGLIVTPVVALLAMADGNSLPINGGASSQAAKPKAAQDRQRPSLPPG